MYKYFFAVILCIIILCCACDMTDDSIAENKSKNDSSDTYIQSYITDSETLLNTDVSNDYSFMRTTLNSYKYDIIDKNCGKTALCFTDIDNLTLYSDGLDANDAENYTINKISYHNLDVECNPKLTLYPRFLTIIKTNDYLIVGNITDSKNTPLLYYIFPHNTNTYTYIFNDIREDEYELRFYNEDGILTYVKNNFDYTNAQQVYQCLIDAYTGDDVFFMEKGTVELIDNEITFIQDERMTVNEWYRSDNFNYHMERDKYQCKTMGEFIERLKQEGLGK